MAETEVKSKFETEFKRDYLDDWDIHRNVVQNFDALEAMVLGQVYDAVSNSIDSSKITDSYTTTLAIERAARVMGKLPEGQTVATAKADQGTAAFFDILRQKWIYPNANAQLPFELKLELWQFYSDVYGYMPMFRDWNVAPTGYVGPDCWLWSPRNLVFQQGRNFFKDMDYVTALTWVGKRFLQDIVDDQKDTENSKEKEDTGGWDLEAVAELIEQADKAQSTDAHKDTQTERTRIAQATKKGVCLATRYEAGDEGEWVTFAPDHGFVEVRRLKNPHKNGQIPFTLKYSQELYDSVYGLGDFSRAKPLQFARDGLTNFYFKGIKMNLIPPIVANANGVLKHTLDYREGAVMLETIPNSIRRLETSNAGLATYQAAQTALTGSLLTVFGSQNAAAPAAETLNPSQGKTPAAINLYADKEADRDGRARKRLEIAIEELTDGFFSLIANIGTEDIPVSLFAKDIEEIVKSGTVDVLGITSKNFTMNASGTGGELKINPEKLKDIECRFSVERNSTAVINKQQQLAQLENLMGNIAKFQNQFKDDPSISVNWGKIMETYSMLTTLPGADEFITIKSPEEVQKIMQQQAEAQAKASQTPPKSPSESMSYKDVPEDVKRQIEAQAGLQPSQEISPSGTDQAHKTAQMQQGMSEPSQPEELAPEPTINKGGMFKDQHLGAAAEHIASL